MSLASAIQFFGVGWNDSNCGDLLKFGFDEKMMIIKIYSWSAAGPMNVVRLQIAPTSCLSSGLHTQYQILMDTNTNAHLKI